MPAVSTASSARRRPHRPWAARVARLSQRLSAFKRVVIWGHPIHSHTHSYVHEGFARAFRWLGADTLWTDDRRALGHLDLAGTLFLTEGQAFDGMPLRRDCRYVLHNVSGERYAEVADRALLLQVHEVTVRSRCAAGAPIEKLDEYTFLERPNGAPVTLHQPWATDLLPDEFDFEVRFPEPWPRSRARAWLRVRRTGLPSAMWVGTIGGGQYGNVDELEGFRRGCADGGVRFVHRAGVDRQQHLALIRSSLLAPTIVGRWQLEHGYLPCRIFKNISYGRLGITNSPWVQAIFDCDILYRSDTEELFWSATNFVRERPMLVAQMNEVQARHTFVDRIERIVACLP
ncbi:MAG: hypothetical protein ACYCXW_04035 [Solirubrobacteraceae bacterium]